jgi:formamidopyrimidine-DNA glycosylase
MPEIPDLNIFRSNLAKRLIGQTLTTISIIVPRKLKVPEAAVQASNCTSPLQMGTY